MPKRAPEQKNYFRIHNPAIFKMICQTLYHPPRPQKNLTDMLTFTRPFYPYFLHFESFQLCELNSILPLGLPFLLFSFVFSSSSSLYPLPPPPGDIACNLAQGAGGLLYINGTTWFNTSVSNAVRTSL